MTYQNTRVSSLLSLSTRMCCFASRVLPVLDFENQGRLCAEAIRCHKTASQTWLIDHRNVFMMNILPSTYVTERHRPLPGLNRSDTLNLPNTINQSLVRPLTPPLGRRNNPILHRPLPVRNPDIPDPHHHHPHILIRHVPLPTIIPLFSVIR